MMQFSINKNAFLKALQIVKQAIGSKVTIPVLTKLKLTASSEGLTLIGSNGQVTIEHFIKISDPDAGMLIESSGAILVEANFFESIIANLPDITLEFKVIDHQQVSIISGKADYTLAGLDAEQYPRIQEIETDNPLVINVGILKQLFVETVFAASKQESRPILTGLHLQVQENQHLKAVATDSHRMSQKIIKLEKMSPDFDVVVPNPSIKAFQGVFKDDNEEVELFFSESQLLFRTETISFHTRLVEGNYPETDRLIPKASDYTLSLSFETIALKQAMDRAKLLSAATSNGTVKLSITGEQIVASVNSPEVGHSHEELTALSKTGDDLTISFNPQFMIDALRVIDSKEVRIQFISSVRPFTLVPATDQELSDSFVQLVTPVRTN